ncbi:MAG TPA: YetF domain-containing protein, partial [Woeseiaceae bacterium]
TVLVGILAYAGVILLLRLSGRRTLSKMNAFDLIVTVALGSTLATVLLNKDVTLAQGMLAFATLIGLQFIITWASVRARWVRQLVTGEPALLFYKGAFLSQALRSARVTEDEVRASIRSAGVLALEDIEAVVLETDGTFSVVRPDGAAGQTSLAGIAKPS